MGQRLPGSFAEKDIPEIAAKLVAVYAAHAAPKERFGDLIERIGLEKIMAALE